MASILCSLLLFPLIVSPLFGFSFSCKSSSSEGAVETSFDSNAPMFRQGKIPLLSPDLVCNRPINFKTKCTVQEIHYRPLKYGPDHYFEWRCGDVFGFLAASKDPKDPQKEMAARFQCYGDNVPPILNSLAYSGCTLTSKKK